MPQVPIIGQGTTTSDDPEFASLDPEQQEKLRQMAEENPDGLESVDDAVDVTTAYFVVVHLDGRIDIDVNVESRYAPTRMAISDDVISSATVAISDLQAQKTAQVTAMAMAQMGQVMAQQREAQMVQQKLAQGKGFRNL